MNNIINYAIGLNAKENVIQLMQKEFNYQSTKEEDIAEWEHIIDYLIHKDFDNLDWASFQLLKEKARKWTEMLGRNVIRIDEEEGIDYKTVLDFEDGFRFVKLLSEKAYTREGNLMRHCVASYYNRNVEIYSLRDSFNKPHCTVEKNKQIKGKGNGDISPKYIHYVVEFLEFMGMNVRETEMENLGYKKVAFLEYVKDSYKSKMFRGKYVKENEKLEYSDDVIVFTDINEAVKYKGDKICLFDGSADFHDSKITSLGQLKSIGGDADFHGSKITSLGQLKSIGGSVVYFSGSNITDLGQLKSIGGNVNFDYSKTTSLGNLKEIGGSASFTDSNITSLGNLEKVGDCVWFECSNITSLGNLKEIGGNADFRGSNITSLGNLETIGGDVDFRDSNITNLGNLKEIGGSAWFTDSNITSLGNLEKVGDCVWFQCSNITSLGNLKEIGGTILGSLKEIGGR